MANWCFGHSHQLLLNEFFDSSTPFMREIDNQGEKKGGGKEKIRIVIVATKVVAS